MSRAAWIVTGVVAALVVVPTVAVAATSVVSLKGNPSGNKADVTGAGQLLTTTANPASFFQSGSTDVSSSAYSTVATPPAGLAVVVTTIHVTVFADSSPGAGQYVEFLVETGTGCTGSQLGTYSQVINPASVGEVDVPLEPGLGIPAGDALCGLVEGSVQADASVSGYSVPSSSVTSGPLHRVSSLPRQR
jgi:hypothetical protein